MFANTYVLVGFGREEMFYLLIMARFTKALINWNGLKILYS